MRKLGMLLLVALLAVSLIPASGLAASPWMDEPTSYHKMFGKLKYGAKNILLGWTALIEEPVEHYRMEEGRRSLNVARGFGKGIVNSLIYTVGGILHLVTFPVTSLDVPLPDNGAKWPFERIKPEF